MQAQNPGNSANQSGNQSGSESGGQQSGSNNKPTLSWSQSSSATTGGKSTSTPPPTSNNAKPANTASAANERSSVSAYIGVFVAGLVVGILVGWGITGLRSSPSSDVATNASSTTSTEAAQTTSNNATTSMNLSGATIGSANANPSSTTAPANSGTLTVASQPAGKSVAVSGVDVSQPTWVAIYTDVNGKPGSVLGAQMFFPTSQGGKTSGTITLLNPTVSGNTYFVSEFIDNGTHTFSSKTDRVVTSNGSSVLAQFQAQ